MFDQAFKEYPIRIKNPRHQATKVARVGGLLSIRHKEV
jgi:hypothetical protein